MSRIPLYDYNQLCWFVGHNPSPKSFAVQSYYAHPSNKFWQLLFDAGFTLRLLNPLCAKDLLDFQLGCIDLSERSSVNASALTSEEIENGCKKIFQLVAIYQPKWLAANGLSIGYALSKKKHKHFFGDWGKLTDFDQKYLSNSCETRLWVLPSSSGRAGSFRGQPLTYSNKLVEWKKLKEAIMKNKNHFAP